MICGDPIHSGMAVGFLHIQHRRLAQLFVDFFAARSESRRYDLTPIICRYVKLHVTLETEIFVPMLSRATGDKSISVHAAKEKALIDEMLYELEYPDPGAYGVTEQVYVLSDLIKNHITTAEGPAGLFERTALSTVDVEVMGSLLRTRTQELRDQWDFNHGVYFTRK
jgi:hypothetical protein